MANDSSGDAPAPPSLGKDAIRRARGFFKDAHRGEVAAGDQVGRYQVLREIGCGGMAVVFEAFDPELKRTVALKILRGGTIQRLHREAIAAARLKHPNVVAVYEVSADFIAMEYVPDGTLRRALPHMSLAERVAVLATLTDAVAYAHAEGVVHRDLKPDNVLMDGRRIVLTDFGLAKTVEGDNLTRSGATLGTPDYMAPEQVRGQSHLVGPAADIWALGALLHELTAGHPPFHDEAVALVYEKILHDDPPPISGPLGAIAARALEKDPARRYPDAAAMARDLRRYLDGVPVEARLTGPVGRLLRRARRRPAIFALATGAAIALCALVVVFSLGHRDRTRLVDSLRGQARVSLEAALELRRAGAVARMRQFLPPLESAYTEVEERAPELAEPDFLMGRMYRALLEPERARAFQEKALAKDAAFVPALYERALLLSLAYGRRAQIELDAAAIDTGGARPVASLKQAAVSAWDAFFAKRLAGPSSSPTAGSDPSLPVAHGLRAFVNDQYREAHQALDPIARSDETREEVDEVLAWVIRSEGKPIFEREERDWSAIEAAQTAAIARDRGYVPHYLDRAGLYHVRASKRRHLGVDPMPDYDAAIADTDEAIRLAPGNVDAYALRGRVRNSLAEYRQTTGLDPGDALAAAEADLARAIALAPRMGTPYLERSWVRCVRGINRERAGQDALPVFTAAEDDASQSLRLEPESSYAFMTRGRIRAYRAAALARSGGNPEAGFGAAEMDFDRSDEIRRRVASPADWGFWLFYYRGSAWRLRGVWRQQTGADPLPDLAHAQALLDRALVLDANNWWEPWYERGLVHFARAEHHDKAGRRAEARTSYRAAAADIARALTLNPRLALGIPAELARARHLAEN